MKATMIVVIVLTILISACARGRMIYSVPAGKTDADFEIAKIACGSTPEDDYFLFGPVIVIAPMLAAAKKSQKRRCCPPEICDLGAGIHGRHLFQKAESFPPA